MDGKLFVVGSSEKARTVKRNSITEQPARSPRYEYGN
jgi:hypothetical protein